MVEFVGGLLLGALIGIVGVVWIYELHDRDDFAEEMRAMRRIHEPPRAEPYDQDRERLPRVVAPVILVALYLGAIVAANLLTAAFGPAMSIWNAFLFIGLDLSTRDKLHDRWRGRLLGVRMLGLIAAGGALSWLLNRDAGPIALASVVAFILAALTDAGVYHLLRRRGWLERANISNVAGAAVDSLVFPTLAFGGILPWVTFGQFVAKVGGGFVWSLILRRDRASARHEVAA